MGRVFLQENNKIIAGLSIDRYAVSMSHLEIYEIFDEFKTPDSIYKKIIELGRDLPLPAPTLKDDKNLVSGCQSLMYLSAELSEGKLYFSAWSDALISAGLAMILLKAYNGMTPQELLAQPPSFLKELGLLSSLSPSRSNGVISLFNKMKALSLIFLAVK